MTYSNVTVRARRFLRALHFVVVSTAHGAEIGSGAQNFWHHVHGMLENVSSNPVMAIAYFLLLVMNIIATADTVRHVRASLHRARNG